MSDGQGGSNPFQAHPYLADVVKGLELLIPGCDLILIVKPRTGPMAESAIVNSNLEVDEGMRVLLILRSLLEMQGLQISAGTPTLQ